MRTITSKQGIASCGVRGRVVLLPKFGVQPNEPEQWFEVLVSANPNTAAEAATRIAQYIEDVVLGDASVAVQRS